MKKFKQILALILAIVVCVAAMPFNAVFTASAAVSEVGTDEETVYTFTEDFEGETVDFGALDAYTYDGVANTKLESIVVDNANKTEDNDSSKAYRLDMLVNGDGANKSKIKEAQKADGSLADSAYGSADWAKPYRYTSHASASASVWEKMATAGAVLKSMSGQFYKTSAQNSIPNQNGESIYFVYSHENSHNFNLFHVYLDSSTNGNFVIYDFKVALDEETTKLKVNSWTANKTANFGINQGQNSGWIDFDITYNSENKAVLTFTYGENSKSVTSVNPVEDANKVMAIGSGRNSGLYASGLMPIIDNIEMKFVGPAKLEDGVYVFKEDFEGETNIIEPLDAYTYDGVANTKIYGSVIANQNTDAALNAKVYNLDMLLTNGEAANKGKIAEGLNADGSVANGPSSWCKPSYYTSHVSANADIWAQMAGKNAVLTSFSGKFYRNSGNDMIPRSNGDGMYIVYSHESNLSFKAFHIYLTGDTNGNLVVYSLNVNLGGDAPSMTSTWLGQTANFGLNASEISPWINFEVTYNEENKAVLTLSLGENSKVITSSDVVEDANKIVAIGCSRNSGLYASACMPRVDDLKFKFKELPKAEKPTSYKFTEDFEGETINFEPLDAYTYDGNANTKLYGAVIANQNTDSATNAKVYNLTTMYNGGGGNKQLIAEGQNASGNYVTGNPSWASAYLYTSHASLPQATWAKMAEEGAVLTSFKGQFYRNSGNDKIPRSNGDGMYIIYSHESNLSFKAFHIYLSSDTNGNLVVYDVAVTLGNNAPSTVATWLGKTENFALDASVVSPWINFEVTYNEENKAVLTLSSGENSKSITSVSAVETEEKVMAIGTARAGNNWGADACMPRIDNIEMNFDVPQLEEPPVEPTYYEFTEDFEGETINFEPLDAYTYDGIANTKLYGAVIANQNSDSATNTKVYNLTTMYNGGGGNKQLIAEGQNASGNYVTGNPSWASAYLYTSHASLPQATWAKMAEEGAVLTSFKGQFYRNSGNDKIPRSNGDGMYIIYSHESNLSFKAFHIYLSSDTNGNLVVYDVAVTLGNNAPSTVATWLGKTENFGINSSSVSSWIDFEVVYNEEGKAVLTLSSGENTNSFTSGAAVETENKVAAIGTARAGNNWGADVCMPRIDNIAVRFDVPQVDEPGDEPEVNVYEELIADGKLVYTNDFETNGDAIVQTNIYKDNNGADVVGEKAVIDNPQKSDSNNSNKVLKIHPLYNYSNYQGKDTEGVYNRFRDYYSVENELWTTAADNDLTLGYASAVINTQATKSYIASYVIYEYTDANNYRLFEIRNWDTDNTVYQVLDFSIVDGVVEQAYTNQNGGISHYVKGVQRANGNWIKVELTYDAEGKAVITLVNGDKRDSIVSKETTDAAKRFFAVGKVAGFNNNIATPASYQEFLYVDDLTLEFAKENADLADANAFANKYRDLLTKDAAFVAPYDVAEILAANTEFATLSDAAKEVIGNKIADLKVAADKWNIANDETVATSFGNIFATITNSNVKAAYNVYNRLTATQKTMLADEYETILEVYSAIATDANNTTDIAVLGDSNTYGHGVATANRWTNLLATKLGSGYTVTNYGISGFRAVDDTETLTGIQFEETPLSAYWETSHGSDYDVVVIALGANDAAYVNDDAKRAKWELVYEELVQSYMALESSPVIILANKGRTMSTTSTERDPIYDYTNSAIANIANKYGLVVMDFNTAYDVNLNLFQSDNLHWNEAGHEWMAGYYVDAITPLTANAYSLADQKVFYNYDAEDITAVANGLTPVIKGATIKNSLNNQDMRFAVTVNKNVPIGKEIAEYGMILADYRNITSGELSLEDLTFDATDSRIVIGRSKEASNADKNTEYYVNVGGISEDNYGAPIIARAYVKYTDGTVVYSVNTTEGSDYSTRTGVKDGYAVRSIVSITKAMLVHLDKQGINVSDLVKIENGEIVAYINADGQESNTPEDVTKLFARIQDNVSYLAG